MAAKEILRTVGAADAIKDISHRVLTGVPHRGLSSLKDIVTRFCYTQEFTSIT